MYVTHRSGDKGVDVVAVKGEDYYAIQCKHSKKNIGQECMSEVLAGAKYYEAIYGKKLTPLSWTNSYYSPTAIDFAQNIGVKSFDRNDLTRWIQDCSVSLKDVYKLDNTRS